MQLDKNYWQERYAEQQTGWDAGSVTRPLKEYFDQLEDKSIKILIPGCGNAHEAAYLFNMGFKNVFLCDWAEAPLQDFANRFPDFPKNQLLHADFFELEEYDFDLIIEQTFFCALDPQLRLNYASKIYALLSEKGKLVGLLFNFPLTKEGPPFGGCKEEYLEYLELLFNNIYIEPCYNSIKPREGRELFIKISKS
jgi:hypothetical protein